MNKCMALQDLLLTLTPISQLPPAAAELEP